MKGINLDLHIASMVVPEGVTSRSDCPICGHANSFSVTNTDNFYLYNCFYANCNISGRIRRGHSTADKKQKQQRLDFSVETSCWIPLARKPEALDYIRNNNVEHAYTNKHANIQYDVKENRVVFCVYDKLTIVDAVGRTLSNKKPKWKRYSSARVPFITRNTSKECVIVEDCASACAVTQANVTGVALMGTNLIQEYIPHVKHFKTAIVALDKDASQKSLKIAKELSVHMSVQILFIDRDIKTWSLNKIQERFMGEVHVT